MGKPPRQAWRARVALVVVSLCGPLLLCQAFMPPALPASARKITSRTSRLSPLGISSIFDQAADHPLEEDESSDFYNPQNIQEGDKVKVISKHATMYHIPKTGPEGINTEGLVGEVASIKIKNKSGSLCTANRPVVVKFTEPKKFMAHYEFRELDLVSKAS